MKGIRLPEHNISSRTVPTLHEDVSAMPTSEELARVKIDKQLKAAGWIVQDFKALELGAGQGVR